MGIHWEYMGILGIHWEYMGIRGNTRIPRHLGIHGNTVWERPGENARKFVGVHCLMSAARSSSNHVPCGFV